MSFEGLKIYKEPDRSKQEELVRRPGLDFEELSGVVDDVFSDVRNSGDEALRAYTERFDKVTLDQLSVSQSEVSEAIAPLDQELKNAIDLAYANIYKFHDSQNLEKELIETFPGVQCWRESRPIEKVGLYIPGGTAPLFSTVLMLGIPAQIAECHEVILCTPPSADGRIHPAILYAADKCGISKIYKVGGAQAIAAMVFGTDSIPAVYKIFGPGNQYVTAAKMKALNYNVAIDLPAGPSEVLVYADTSANAAFIAADLLSQAEHGKDSQVVLVVSDASIVSEVNEQLKSQLETLARKEIAKSALQNGYACVFGELKSAFEFINRYAPEHFIICSDLADDTLHKITNAGSVFVGHFTPESAGDYASGTNHTLPTAAFARSYSGVSLDSFVKKITFQRISKDGLKGLGPTIRTLAENEELQAHANAVKIRMDAL